MDLIYTTCLAYVANLVLLSVSPILLTAVFYVVSSSREDYSASLYILGSALGFAAPVATVICLWRRRALNRRQAR